MSQEYDMLDHGAMVIRFMGRTTYVNRIGGKKYVRTVDSVEERRIMRRLWCSLLLDEMIADELETSADVIQFDTEQDI